MVANTPLMISIGNGVAAPVDVLIATIIMFLFTVGFVAMSKYIDNAGAFYAFSVVAFVILAAIGADPATEIYAWGAMAGTLGYMVILSLTCAAVVFFFRKEKHALSTWKTLVAPTGGLVGVLGCLWVAISNLPDLIGGDNAKTVSILVVLFLLSTFVFGYAVAERFRKRSPQRYEALRQLA